MEIFVKDMDLHKFLRKVPEQASNVMGMRSMLPDGYSHYLVDFVVMDCEPGMKTCRDTRWHFDGDHKGNNLYVLRVEGPNRTEFLDESVELGDFPDDRESQNRLLEEMLSGRKTKEIPEGEPVLYDSRTPHRGVVCNLRGRRVFLRLLATDRIKPKNIVRRGDEVPFRSAV